MEAAFDSEGSCRLKCVEDERCQSYNFATAIEKNNAEKFQCQLGDFDRFASMDNFTKDEDFKYRGVQVLQILLFCVLSLLGNLCRYNGIC